eukprot:1158273-Pelagomonas_calceolata.AAC.5
MAGRKPAALPGAGADSPGPGEHALDAGVLSMNHKNGTTGRLLVAIRAIRASLGLALSPVGICLVKIFWLIDESG